MNNRTERPKYSVSFRTRLLISSLLGTVPLILLGILLLISRYQARRDAILQSNLTIARTAAASIDGWVNGNIFTLQTLASSNEIQQGSPADIQGLVERQKNAQPAWANLWVTDAEGQIIISTARPLVYIGDREHFEQAKRTLEPAVSNLITSRSTGRSIIVIAVPILRGGEFTGAIGAQILPESIQRIFSTFAPPEEQTVLSLWGSDHRLIAASSMDGRKPGWQAPDGELAPLFSGRSDVMIARSPFTGERTLYGYDPVRSAPWIVVAGTPFAAAMAPVYRDFAIFIILSFAVLGLTLWWSFYSATVLARRVSRLADYARTVGAGSTEPLRLQTGDELEDLSDSLSDMASDLATLDRLKSDLLTMVSHELKTPLTSIRASLDLLSSGVLTPDQPAYRETLDIACRQSRRLQDLIENLINVARLQTGELTVNPQPVLLASIVQSSVGLYIGTARDRGLALQSEVPEDLRVLADAPKITLALNNLLDNAVKFTEQGSITVRARQEDGNAVVTVTDTGAGLSDEVRDRLFRQFYQGEPLLTRRAGGVGLGLWVTRTIIEAHGGRVFAESEGPGQGSTFGFTLPLAPEGN
ncbi:MAG: sensor histidine kinase [Armatimonadota bacterium]